MISRRLVLAAAALWCVSASAASAQDWKAKYPELVMALVPAENATGVLARVGPFADYLTQQLGVKVTLRVANDYTAVIEGQKNRQIHIGQYGPGSYARANAVSNGNVIPFVTLRNSGGVIGYYSVMYVRADSEYKSVGDLKGKVLGLVDVESTSGYKAPTFFLADQGFPVEKHFKLAQATGSHENAIFALAGGTVDAAVNWWNAEDDSNLRRMLTKGMLKKADGTAMTPADFRIVWKSPLLPGSPFALLADMPEDLKAAIIQAFVDAPKKNKVAFDALTDGKVENFARVSKEDYVESVKMNLWLDQQRKHRGN
ncbi:phosphonate ABC transporter substrate-binding protein [Bradyrhizobium sp. AUGA SZCCT0431]|uniref:phosphonate ABC transporter substrate-binding protein n=1 Tax=Bradyrhizobium sp. AUGA SZCCT0431 TaxID=2807674 RepID=UPI001BA5647D|nr:phosphonate ABC transporter substrate-binding protein [Bradyrhizobium sp. AUGA SZCCT0431]MBR1143788.1 phosphonate ABC transporter substrate-binding protein [Bradyrhizobium sp. AUGA SZCCT0431]